LCCLETNKPTTMGGARSLKLEGQRGVRAKAQGEIFFLCVGQCRPLFSCCVHQKDVAGCRGPGAEPLVRKSGGEAPKAETLLGFGLAMEVANLPALYYLETQKIHRYLCFLAKITFNNSHVGHQNFFWGGTTGGSKGAGAAAPALPLAPPMLTNLNNTRPFAF